GGTDAGPKEEEEKAAVVKGDVWRRGHGINPCHCMSARRSAHDLLARVPLGQAEAQVAAAGPGRCRGQQYQHDVEAAHPRPPATAGYARRFRMSTPAPCRR